MPVDPARVLLAMAGMGAIVAARYLLTSGLFAALSRGRGPAMTVRLARQVRREIGWSLIAALIYGAPAGIAAYAWLRLGQTRLYTDPHAHPLWWLPASVLVYLFAHDTWFYWTHRWAHASPRLFRAAHAVHHASRPPTAWAAMAFHPWEALSAAWLIPALTFVVPIHIGALVVVMLIATVMGTTNHMGWELFPARWIEGRFGAWIISASHHGLHHQRYASNLGLYFRFWDRLCGTDGGLSGEYLDAKRARTDRPDPAAAAGRGARA